MFHNSSFGSDLDDTSSILTLVNPPNPKLKSEMHTELVINKTSTLNNVLLHNGSPYFNISTHNPAAADTDITDARTGEVLVTIRRHVFRSDEVTLMNHGASAMKVGKTWLKESKMPDGVDDVFENRPRWDFASSVEDFAWRLDVVHRLVLCPASDMGNPIAWIQLPELDGSNLKTPALVVPSASESMWDVIVAGWVILEQKVRLDEK
ncbi:hypothetical protein BJ165DRAFT_1464077 [Panaeolus papilionaceus]|nr:hypothetical protein BJ165DRAFT_1464077 [Panaeolus papilionaceus]